jgi:glycosyltransferase involved in cell wall biosynthesis
MRILVLTPEPPAARHVNGGTTRQFQLYSRLVEHGHEVVVAGAFPHVGEYYDDELTAAGFEVSGYRRPESKLREIAGAVLRRPMLLFDALRLNHNNLVSALLWVRLKPSARELAQSGEFDAIVVEHESCASWLSDLRLDRLQTRRPVTVLVDHQVECAYFEQRAARRTGPARVLAAFQMQRQKWFERRWLSGFDRIVCMSEREIELLQEAVPDELSAFAIGNGADIEEFADIAPDPLEQRVLFTGTMTFPPNELAADWVAREVMPLVRTEIPGASLEIVGRNPGAATWSLAKLPGVSVHGSVPEMKPFFAHASVCVLPMLEGGGTRLKLAEALAAERAVVSTTNGATGVAVENGRDVLIADDARDFAAAIVLLLRDDELRAKIASAGCDFAQEHLDWTALGDQWEASLLALVGANTEAVLV